MRVHKFHYDDGVEGDVDLECLGIFIAELDKPVQSQSLLIALLGSEHCFIDALLLLFVELDLDHTVVT